jgi:hypothetical protein
MNNCLANAHLPAKGDAQINLHALDAAMSDAST